MLENCIKENHEADYFENLVGESIVSVESKAVGYILITKSGKELVINENTGCGGCQLGWSQLPHLEELAVNENVITNVKVEDTINGEFNLYVYYSPKNYIVLDGDNAEDNGYYGTGFWITVTDVKNSDDE